MNNLRKALVFYFGHRRKSRPSKIRRRRIERKKGTVGNKQKIFQGIITDRKENDRKGWDRIVMAEAKENRGIKHFIVIMARWRIRKFYTMERTRLRVTKKRGQKCRRKSNEESGSRNERMHQHEQGKVRL